MARDLRLGVNVGYWAGGPPPGAAEMVVEAEHPTIGAMRVIGRPVKFPDAPQPPVTAPPTFGQHTAQVLRDELGYGEAEIAALQQSGVIDRKRR